MNTSIHDHFMREALKQAQLAYDKGEIPVGAVVVLDNKVIARAHNQMESLHDPTAHAEMIALTQASAAVAEGKEGHRGSLEKASLYVTLEPCSMCAGAIVLTKCSHLIYGASDPKAGACGSVHNLVEHDKLNHRANVVRGVMENDSKLFLQDFFKTLRKDRR